MQSEIRHNPDFGVLRVTFASPVVPGVHEVTLSNMMDTHGNAGPSGAQVVTQPSPVVNAFDTSAAVTVANTGGDYVQATFVQGRDQRAQAASRRPSPRAPPAVPGQ